MKLVWSPERASKAYIDTVKSCELDLQQSGESELISALAGGWNAKMIVEACSHGGAGATSVGLAIAAHHTGGRYICMVPDESTRQDYLNAVNSAGVSPPPEVVVGPAEEAVAELVGIDFLLVDGRCKGFGRLIRLAKLSHRGAVLVCRRTVAGFRWGGVLGSTTRIVRSVELPVGEGLDIAYAAGNTNSGSTKSNRRWIKHVDQKSGEEHLIRG
ncbi:uncharacterized protein LOC127802545 [Diospyros lotus]|uniref:uncharacterized protein LOC127802545 n=1 Tax=Diospyros lotus TaxID=55363 RepID=UPI00225A9E9F|nr:uncharacterized protein LOC127802545 [Diospyros lotus]